VIFPLLLLVRYSELLRNRTICLGERPISCRTQNIVLNQHSSSIAVKYKKAMGNEMLLLLFLLGIDMLD
jgi:hypothetical protein